MSGLKTTAQTIVLADGYSSGRLLARALKAKGHRLVHVATSSEIPSCFVSSYEPTLFDFHLVWNPDQSESILSELKALETSLVLPGAESGVELADILGERLNLLGNGTSLSPARRDKYLMVEALKKKGVRTVSHFKSGNVEDILNWAVSGGQYPIVVKPPKSAGADSVVRCESEADVRRAFSNIMGRKNQLGLENEFVIAQRFLAGTEYIVNTVSRDGQVLVCDIWKCLKKPIPGHGWISCTEELIGACTPEEQALEGYAKSVVLALEIQQGPAHLEIMLTVDGPVLIEVGARIQGAINPASISEATGTNQLELTVEAYLEPEKFFTRFPKGRTTKKGMLHAFLISPIEGKLKDIPKRAELEGIPSMYFLQVKVKKDERIPRTVDLFSSIGVADLINEDLNQLSADYSALRSLEENGLYEVY